MQSHHKNSLIVVPVIFLVSVILTFIAPTLLTAETIESSYLHAKPQDIDKWQQRRFGMFIHWDPISLLGTEISWSRAGKRPGRKGTGFVPVDVYDNLYKSFYPAQFDAEKWVKTAKDAGMKYIVFTTKHHDGFCMFHTRQTDYNIANSPFKRDIVAELARACHKANMPLGLYFSQPDWHHPDYRNGSKHRLYIRYMQNLLRELCTNYGQIYGIWFDGLGGSAKDWDAKNTFKLMRQLQPNLIINNRCGISADYDTPEQRIGKFQIKRPWESCMTISAHNHWAWGGIGDGVKSLKECLTMLIRCAGGDGNMLMNVGPMPTGEIGPQQVKRLQEMGQWLQKYGESIYNTRGGPYKPGPWGVCTRKDNYIYLHVMNWTNNSLTLIAPGEQIISCKLLTGGKVDFIQKDEKIIFTVAKQYQQPIDTIIKLHLASSAMRIAPLNTALVYPPGNLARSKKASASNIFNNENGYRPGLACDNDPETRWATDAGTHSAWLQIDLKKPTVFNRVLIDEREWNRIKKFRILYKTRESDIWKTAFTGSAVKGMKILSLKPVTARYVRLYIMNATDGPTIWEFQLFYTHRI